MTEEEKKDLFEVQEEHQIELFNQENELAHNTTWVIAHWINEIKKIEKQQSEMYEQIKVQMEQRGIKKFENDFKPVSKIG